MEMIPELPSEIVGLEVVRFNLKKEQPL